MLTIAVFPFRPFSDRVLVDELKDIREIDGVTIPDTTQEKPERIGIVMSCGPKVEETKQGDRVTFGPYSGRPYVISGKEFVLLREGEISGAIQIQMFTANCVQCGQSFSDPDAEQVATNAMQCNHDLPITKK